MTCRHRTLGLLDDDGYYRCVRCGVRIDVTGKEVHDA